MNSFQRQLPPKCTPTYPDIRRSIRACLVSLRSVVPTSTTNQHDVPGTNKATPTENALRNVRKIVSASPKGGTTWGGGG